MKVVVALPAQEMMHTSFAMSLINMIGYCEGHKDLAVSVSQQNGCYLDHLRNQLVVSAREMKGDYILFLDSDMTFPKETLLQLLSHGKDIIGCNYVRRLPPHTPIAMTHADPNNFVEPSTTGMTQVGIIPTGILLIKMSIFEQMKYPWFQSIWRASDNRLVGEDVYFCAKLGDMKIPIYCDHDLSQEVGHCGQVEHKLKYFV